MVDPPQPHREHAGNRFQDKSQNSVKAEVHAESQEGKSCQEGERLRAGSPPGLGCTGGASADG